MDYPFGQLVSAVLAVSPLIFLWMSSLFAGRAAWGTEKALTLSTVQQRIKYRLSTLICINTNPKHSTTWAVMKKINSTTDKKSIHLCVKMKNFSLHFQFVVWKWAFYVYVVIHALRDLRKPIWFILAKRKLTGMWNCNLSILLVQNFVAICVGFLES